jgi:hypothetical protein
MSPPPEGALTPAASNYSTSLGQSIDKLDGAMATGKSHYHMWNFRLSRFLKAKDLLIIVLGDKDTAAASRLLAATGQKEKEGILLASQSVQDIDTLEEPGEPEYSNRSSSAA